MHSFEENETGHINPIQTGGGGGGGAFGARAHFEAEICNFQTVKAITTKIGDFS